MVGCGGGDETTTADVRVPGAEVSDSQAERGKAAVRGYLDARAEGEWQRACSYFDGPTRALLARIVPRLERGRVESCATFMELSTEALSGSQRAALGTAEFVSVRAKGSVGYVTYKDADGVEREMAMKVNGDDWIVAAVEATPTRSAAGNQ